MELDNESFDEILPYYVYELRDPTKEGCPVFYVGKGTRDRGNAHEREAEGILSELEANKLLNQEKDDENNRLTAKNDRILTIKKSEGNPSPIVLIIGRYNTAEKAFAVESTLIHWIYGKENLTNIASGHNSKYIRPKSNLDSKNGAFEKLPHIDIEKVRSTNGEYTAEEIRKAQINNTEEKLRTLKSHILKEKPELTISDPDFTRPDFPSLFVHINNFTRCQLAIRNSSTGNVIMNIKPINNKESRDLFEAKYKNTHDIEIKGNNGDRYFKMKGWKDNKVDYLNDVLEICDRIALAIFSYGNL